MAYDGGRWFVMIFLSRTAKNIENVLGPTTACVSGRRNLNLLTRRLPQRQSDCIAHFDKASHNNNKLTVQSGQVVTSTAPRLWYGVRFLGTDKKSTSARCARLVVSTGVVLDYVRTAGVTLQGGG